MTAGALAELRECLVGRRRLLAAVRRRAREAAESACAFCRAARCTICPAERALRVQLGAGCARVCGEEQARAARLLAQVRELEGLLTGNRNGRHDPQITQISQINPRDKNKGDGA